MVRIRRSLMDFYVGQIIYQNGEVYEVRTVTPLVIRRFSGVSSTDGTPVDNIPRPQLIYKDKIITVSGSEHTGVVYKGVVDDAGNPGWVAQKIVNVGITLSKQYEIVSIGSNIYTVNNAALIVTKNTNIVAFKTVASVNNTSNNSFTEVYVDNKDSRRQTLIEEYLPINGKNVVKFPLSNRIINKKLTNMCVLEHDYHSNDYKSEIIEFKTTTSNTVKNEATYTIHSDGLSKILNVGSIQKQTYKTVNGSTHTLNTDIESVVSNNSGYFKNSTSCVLTENSEDVVSKSNMVHSLLQQKMNVVNFDTIKHRLINLNEIVNYPFSSEKESGDTNHIIVKNVLKTNFNTESQVNSLISKKLNKLYVEQLIHRMEVLINNTVCLIDKQTFIYENHSIGLNVEQPSNVTQHTHFVVHDDLLSRNDEWII
jgi:hypothetical protein